MSGYCKVVHDNVELRSWFRDDGQTYRLGDKVDCQRHFDWPGEWIDGVHEAETDDEQQYWVVIKDQLIVAVQVREYYGHPAEPDDLHSVKMRYHLTAPPPREWWPEMAWEAQAWRTQLWEDLRKARESKNPACDAINEFTRAKMREPGFFKMIFGPWDEIPGLTAPAHEALLNWGDWRVPLPMLADAIRYKVERHLREIGKWDTTKFLSIHVDTHPFQPQVRILELRGERRPAE